jgi:3-methyl-2-oxobutanoate hydroxymethyltransferase
MSRLTPQLIKKLKGQRKLSMVTCYDAGSARLLDQSQVDIILVGDSVAMVVHGYPSTIHASMEMMLLHVAAVRRGSTKFMVADLPFLIHRQGKYSAVVAAGQLLQAGADAIKLEGVKGHEEVIQHLVDSGIPVMGHTGLIPQAIAAIGGWKVQGKTKTAAEAIEKDAKDLEQLGCFSLVLECIPESLANRITENSAIPTIGIGAGCHTDGQVLVWQDLMGLNSSFKPKFVRHFASLEKPVIAALNQYHQAVLDQTFPNEMESYHL